MNVEIGTEAPIFLFWEYLFQIFGILSLQCRVKMRGFAYTLLASGWYSVGRTSAGCTNFAYADTEVTPVPPYPPPPPTHHPRVTSRIERSSSKPTRCCSRAVICLSRPPGVATLFFLTLCDPALVCGKPTDT